MAVHPVDERDDWTDDDLRDVALTGMQHIERMLAEEENA
jgi:hypothetical protein